MKLHFSCPHSNNLPLWRWGYSGFTTDWSQHLCDVQSMSLCSFYVRPHEVTFVNSTLQQVPCFLGKILNEILCTKFIFWIFVLLALLFINTFTRIGSREVIGNLFHKFIKPDYNFPCRYILLLKNFDRYVRILKPVIAPTGSQSISNLLMQWICWSLTVFESIFMGYIQSCRQKFRLKNYENGSAGTILTLLICKNKQFKVI